MPRGKKRAATSAATEESVENVPNDKPKTTKKKAEPKKKTKKDTVQSSIHHILERTAVQEVLPWMKEGAPITVSTNQTFFEALLVLVQSHILSAPVHDKQEGKFIGFVDTVDLACACVEIAEQNGSFNPDKDQDDDANLIENLMLDSVSTKSLADFSHRDAFKWVLADDKLLQVATLLSHEGGYHRVAVVDSADKPAKDTDHPSTIRGLVTQSGLIEYLFEEHAPTLEKYRKKVSDLNLTSSVFSVKVTQKAIDALKLMKEKKVSGLAVVQPSGELVDVISASDLVLWTEWVANDETFRFRDFSAIGQSVLDFLNNSRTQRNVNANKRPLVCQHDSALYDVLSTMLENNVHRLFVVNEANVPVSVVTYGEILSELVKAPQ